jgi:hypothetical protein
VLEFEIHLHEDLCRQRPLIQFRSYYLIGKRADAAGWMKSKAISVMGVPRATSDDRLLYPIHNWTTLILCRLEHTDRRCRRQLDT